MSAEELQQVVVESPEVAEDNAGIQHVSSLPVQPEVHVINSSSVSDTSEEGSEEKDKVCDVYVSQMNSLAHAIAQMGEKLEKFSGTDKFGFREFKLSFENFQHLYKWDERQSKHKLIATLTGSALSFVSELDIDSNTTKQLLDLLKKRFDDEHLVDWNEARFDTAVKRKSQSWLEYVSELRRLSCKAFPEFNSVARDRLVSRKLIDQIPYGSLKTHIKVNHIKDCETICSLILEWPALVGKDNEVQGEKKTDHKNFKYIKHLEGKVDKLEEDMKSLPYSHHAVMQNQSRNKVYTPKCTKCGTSSHATSECTLPDRMCYNCKNLGHIARDCPESRIPFMAQNSFQNPMNRDFMQRSVMRGAHWPRNPSPYPQ